jgi:hypothetical protein
MELAGKPEVRIIWCKHKRCPKFQIARRVENVIGLLESRFIVTRIRSMVVSEITSPYRQKAGGAMHHW